MPRGIPTPPPGCGTMKDFAARIKSSVSWVSQLGQAGRLVMNGKWVDFDASMKKIAETAGAPERSAVVTADFGAGKEKKEHYQAELARLDYEERCGQLLRADDVVQAASSCAVVLRTRLEATAEQLAPQLAGLGDEQRIKAKLSEHIEGLLNDCVQALSGLAAAGKA